MDAGCGKVLRLHHAHVKPKHGARRMPKHVHAFAIDEYLTFTASTLPRVAPTQKVA
jgi:hypothetical protein